MKQPWYLKSNVVYSVLFFFVLSLVGSPTIWADGQTPARQQLSYAEAREKLALFFRQLKKLRATFDETDFNPTARARAIGPEIDALFRFVRDEIAYEPYQGVLRFAAGTLMSRAGNACDQSLLLAEFLRTHGYQVRFAQARLTDDQARTVLSQTKRPSALSWRQQLVQDPNDPLLQALEPLETQDDELKVALRQANAELSAFLQALSEDFEFDYAILTDQLKQAGITFQPPGDKEGKALLVDVREHCWLQVRQDNQWVDLDPSLSTLEVGQRFMAPTLLSEDPPHNLSYKLKVNVFIEQVKQGKRQPREEVLSHSAVLLQDINHLSLAIVPEFSAGSVSAQLANPEFVRNFEVVWPVLTVNGENISGQPFNLEGEQVNADPQARLAEAIRKPLGGGLGGIGGALEDIFEPPKSSEAKAPSQLGRVWMTLTLVSPDGKEKVLERELARRLGDTENDEQKAKNEFRRQFLSSFDILSTGSHIPRRSVDARYLDYILANRSFFFAALADSYGKPVPNWNAILDSKVKEFPLPLLQFFYMRTALLDFNAVTYFPGLLAFAAEPQVVAFRQGTKLRVDGTPVMERRFDIMWHAIRAVDLLEQATSKNRSTDFNLQQGILDTLIEYLLLGGGEAVNAHTVLAEAVRTGVSLATAQDTGQSALAAFAVDESTKAHLARDLQHGYAVIAPSRPIVINKEPTFAWWRVDPTSGETLGMAGVGEGAAQVEWSTLNAAALLIVTGGFCGGIVYIEQGSFKTFLSCFVIMIGTIVLFTAATFTVTWVLRGVVVRFLGWTVTGAPTGGFLAGLAGAVTGGFLGTRPVVSEPASETGRFAKAGKPGRSPAEGRATTEPVPAREVAEGAGEAPATGKATEGPGSAKPPLEENSSGIPVEVAKEPTRLGETPAEGTAEDFRLGEEPPRPGETSSGASGEATRSTEEAAKTSPEPSQSRPGESDLLPGSSRAGRIDESERIFSDKEKRIAQVLKSEGKEVKALLERPDASGRQADSTVDGVVTEFKSLDPPSGNSPDTGATSATVKNTINASIRRGGQARDIIIDARGSGLTKTEAQRGLARAGNITRGKIDRVRIIGDGFDLTSTDFQ